MHISHWEGLRATWAISSLKEHGGRTCLQTSRKKKSHSGDSSVSLVQQREGQMEQGGVQTQMIPMHPVILFVEIVTLQRRKCNF
jgi:hypothetical protein